MSHVRSPTARRRCGASFHMRCAWALVSRRGKLWSQYMQFISTDVYGMTFSWNTPRKRSGWS